MIYFDAHNHLQDDWLRPHRAAIMAQLEALPVAGSVVNGTCEADWPEVAALARSHRWIRPSYGLHPWDVGNAGPGWREALRARLEDDPGAAVGEVGLDRWILARAKPDDPRLAGMRRAPLEEQVEAFRWQLALAVELNRPVTIHCLDAWGPLHEVLRTAPRPKRGFLLHAYGGSAEQAGAFIALGASFSFNGAFLAPRHAARQAVFAQLPGDRLLVETDAPAMSLPPEHACFSLPPTPEGMAINHPANLTAAYAGLAALRGERTDTLARQVADNFRRLVGQELVPSP